ncbi:hypothetical protein [Blastomonas aquatica]|uniref:Uncharacterized protein n=1 Tax=Blastomonas aquatica TaxID=1510276 RepID=A0ABQ1JMY3_9SPHN|nr:hypothetical protein [Blastomonas aquatica]GGB73114.1 hypothetical protein GCM10010833_30390 [Blastomonas aquatica]
MTFAFWFMIAALAPSVAAAETPPSFCQRMAAELPMKEKRVAGSVRAFDMQTLTAAQRLLVGGSTFFSLKVEAVSDSPDEEQRIDAMCSTVPCTMEGPFRLTLGLKDGSAHQFEALPDERARIEYVGTRIRCSDL